jgi:hypothetical protein
LGHRAGRLSASELIAGFAPESPLEERLAEDPELLEGLAWGAPRSGHPEGTVGAHVCELLQTIDASGEHEARRRELRFIALVHDSLKFRVDESAPRTGENHHGMRARRFAQGYTDDERVLATIELHDRPYAIWRRMRRTGALDAEAIEGMLERVPDKELFLRFVEIDGSTEGKKPAPVDWFREELEHRGDIE